MLVEDLVSGIIIQEACLHDSYVDVNVIVNYGVKIDVEVLSKWRYFRRAVVWLDNDSGHVTEQAHKMARVWGMISGEPVSVIEDWVDPKQYTLAIIKDVLLTAMKYG